MTGYELAVAYASVMYAWKAHQKALSASLSALKHHRKFCRRNLVKSGTDAADHRHAFVTRYEKRINKARYKLRSLKPLKELIEYHLKDMDDGTVTRADVTALWPKWMDERGRVVSPWSDKGKTIGDTIWQG